MRILLAEDEYIERKAMRKFIENNFPAVKIVGEAENGRKAIELAASTIPDVIFMDIGMPGINGLEAIEKINAENSAIKFILVSAYDTFEYAKEAMRFGIKDYILKPGKKEEIVKAILRLQKELEAENLRKIERMQTLELIHDRLITDLMHPALQDSTIITLQELFPEVQSACFFVVKQAEKRIVEEGLKQEVDYRFITRQVDDAVVIFLIAKTLLQRSDVLQLAKRLQQKLGDGVYIGIGSSKEILLELPKSYVEAYEACTQLAADEKRQVGFLSTEKIHAREEDVIALIEVIVEKGQLEEAIQKLKKYQETLTINDKEELYMRLKNNLVIRNIMPPSLSFSLMKTNQDWYAFLQVCCNKMKEFHQSKSFIEQAKNFMYTHFQEAITLEDVADYVNLSASYFSNVFKQEFGMNFIEYLTMIRMQKAKELIEENLYALKEISFMVGYKDPNYFSRVFKKYYQESPKQYQQAILK